MCVVERFIYIYYMGRHKHLYYIYIHLLGKRVRIPNNKYDRRSFRDQVSAEPHRAHDIQLRINSSNWPRFLLFFEKDKG